MRAKKILFSLEVFVVSLTLTFYLWYVTESSDRLKHLQTTEISANQLKNGIESFINEKISILLQVRNFWINSNSVTHEHFLAFCREIISQVPGFQAIEFGDTSNKVVWVEPLVSTELAGHFSEASEPIRRKMLNLAVTKRLVAVTPTLDMMEGSKGFIAIVPVFKNGTYEGAIFGVFKINTMFTLIFDSVLKQRYNCSLYDDSTLIYQTESAAQSDWKKSALHVNKTIAVRDHNWNLVLWPRESGDQFGFRGIAFLVLGLALSVVLSSLVWLLSSKAEQADLYASMLEVSHSLSSSTDLNSILRTTGDACLRMTGVDRCAIFFWSESQRQFEPAWLSSTREANFQRFLNLKLRQEGTPIVGKFVEEKRTMLASKTSRLEMMGPSLIREFGIQSLLAVPMMSKGNLIGAITLDHNGKRHRFTGREQALVEGIASQAAVAVENTKLLSEMQKQTELIAKKHKDLESLLVIVSHDLKNPLVALEGMTSLLREESGNQLSENGQHYLSRIQANIRQMDALIKDVHELSRIGRVETQIENLNVKEIVSEVLAELRERPESSNVSILNEVRVERLCYNRRGLKQIFSNLVGNAIKFSAYQENGQVVLGSEEALGEFRFYVKDNGLGIDKQHHQCIFDLFHRLQELKNVEGTGVGLTIVQRILETYGGRVWLDSEKGRGTIFYFSIPKKTEVPVNEPNTGSVESGKSASSGR
jgi:signal transduction histidine kinase/CHASE1-domain containing sensor protein